MLADAVCKAKLLNDFLFFTRYFFLAQYGKRFIVAGHQTDPYCEGLRLDANSMAA
jgi:hypothetical protein